MNRGARTFVLFLATACGSRDRTETTSDLAEGIVAMVGKEPIAKSTVERIAAAQSLAARPALDRALSDALFANEGARRVHPARIRTAERRALARLLLEHTWSEARAEGRPTDAEIAAETARRWWEVDRPPLRRTTHAVVLVSANADESRARAFAQRVAHTVEPATDAATFRSLAASLKEPGLDLRVEDLEPVAANGNALDPSHLPPPGSRLTTYDPAFVEAAFRIPGVGRQSGVVRSSFGYHVILFTELVPEHRVPLEERRERFEEEVLLGRANRLRDAALERARSVDRVEVERAAGELTEKVNVSL